MRYVRQGNMWTDVVLRAEPDLRRLTDELGTVLTGIAFNLPKSYPGVCRILHDVSTPKERVSAKKIAMAHAKKTQAERDADAKDLAKALITKTDLLARIEALESRLGV